MNITKNNKNVPKKNLSNLSSNHSLLIISSDIPVQSLYNLLIQNPTYINKVDSKNETFLSYAIKRNKKDTIDLLLTSPIIDINFQNSKKNSYLHLAVLNQNLELINELINKGIDMNLQNEDGDTALHLAYKIDNKDIIEILINNNINTSIKNNNGDLAINIKPEKSNILKSNNSSNNMYESVNNSGFNSSNSYNMNNSNIYINKNNNNNNSNKINQKTYESSEDFFSSVISNNKNIQSDDNYQIVNDDENNEDIQIYESKNSNLNNNNNINLSVSNSKNINKSIKINLSNNIKNKLNLSKANQNSKNQEFQSQYIYPNNYNNFDNNNQYNNTSNNQIYNNNNLNSHDSKNNINITNNIQEKNEKIYNQNDVVDLFDLTASLDIVKKVNRDKVEDISNLNINKINDDNDNNKNEFKKVSTMDEDLVNINQISNLNIKVENNNNNQFIKKNSKSSNNSDYDDFEENNNFRDTIKPKIEIDDEFAFSSPHIQNLNEITQKNTAVNTASNINSNYNSITKVYESNNNTNKNSILTTQSIKNLMVSNNPSPLPAISTMNISSNGSINYNISQSINNNYNNNNKNLINKPASTPLINFLQKIKMEKYANNLINNGFDDIQLIIEQTKGNNLGITDENLKEAGILLPGDRAKIIIKIQELAKNFVYPIPKGVFYTCDDLDNIDSDIYIRKLNNWLRNLKVENYLMNFISNGYHSLELLLVQMESKIPLNENLLKDLGIDKIGYRTRIINKLKEEAKSLIIQLKKNLLIIDKKGNNDICDCKIF